MPRLSAVGIPRLQAGEEVNRFLDHGFPSFCTQSEFEAQCLRDPQALYCLERMGICQPEQPRPHCAVLAYEAKHAPAVLAFLRSQDERVQSLLGMLYNEEGALVVSTSRRYHTYYAYYLALKTLAPFLANTTFYFFFGQEDDDGNDQYIVDEYRFADGELVWRRRMWPEEDSDALEAALGIHRPQ